MRKCKICAAGAVFLLVCMARPCLAHKVNVFAWVEGQTVHVECRFSGGREVKGGGVRVTDAAGNEVLSGQTDENGRFSFQSPRAMDLRIDIAAGAGHRGEWLVRTAEFGGVVSPSPSVDSASISEAPEEQAPVEGMNNEPSPLSQTAPVDYPQIERMIHQALDQRLQPLTNQLAKQLAADRVYTVRAQDVIGGIGYILGLMGVILYCKSRNDDRSASRK